MDFTPDYSMGISLLQQYQLLYTNDSIPQINNYAVLLIEIDYKKFEIGGAKSVKKRKVILM